MTDEKGAGPFGSKLRMPKFMAERNEAVVRVATQDRAAQPEDPNVYPGIAGVAYAADPRDPVQAAMDDKRRIHDAQVAKHPVQEAYVQERARITHQPQQRRVLNAVQEAINAECWNLCQMLVEKNDKYGNSALDPLRIFSDAHPIEQIFVRIDDKLSRIKSGNFGGGEDTILDLMGYLVLLRIAQNGGVRP